MRILYACHQFFPEHYTGTERYTLALARQVQALGHEVLVCTYEPRLHDDARPLGTTGVLARRYVTHGVRVIGLRHEVHEDAGFGGVSSRVGDGRVEQALETILRDERIECVHCTHPMRQTPLVPLARRLGLPVVLHLTDFWLLCPRGTLLDAEGRLCDGPEGGARCARVCFEPHLAPAIARRAAEAAELASEADVVVAPSRFLAGVFLRHGADGARMIHRTYAFDQSRLAPRARRAREGPVRFAFLGTLLPHKGVEVLVRAVRKIPRANLRVEIYGGHFDQHAYYAKLHALSAGDARIELSGEYDFDDIGAILERTDAVVVPSLWYENNPLVVGAASAMGVPSIVTDLGGMTELVRDGVDGRSFPRGDADALARILAELADDPSELDRLAANVRPPPRIEADAFELSLVYQRLANGEPVPIPASRLLR